MNARASHAPKAPRQRLDSPIERNIFSFIFKHSKRDQFILLLVTLTLFPMLYLTLELPKRIINDAIAAQTDVVEFYGMTFTQIHFLLILCGLFLLSVIAHGLMKMRINTMKGVLAERMLRRYRYGLISRILRFPQPYFERTSQGELVSMVTSESEPMGGLMGDALAQPVADPQAAAAHQPVEQETCGAGACAGGRDRRKRVRCGDVAGERRLALPDGYDHRPSGAALRDPL